jgi:hypothetical protein
VAASLAGQALLAYGLVSARLVDDLAHLLALLVLAHGALFVAFPDRVHRVLMVLAAVASLCALLYVQRWNALIPLLGPALLAGTVALEHTAPRWIGSAAAALLRPLTGGLLLGACGVTLLSTAYLLPELQVAFVFYPRPWLSTLLYGALLLVVLRPAWSALAPTARPGALPVLAGLALLVIAAAWYMPGLLLGLVVMTLGAASGGRVLAGAGLAFAVVFVAAFVYGIEVSLPLKAVSLIAAGAVLLAARVLVLRLTDTATPREANGG